MDEKTSGGGRNGFDGVHGARVIEVIEVRANRGTGTADDPVRAVCRYYSKDGDKLAEADQIGLRALRDRVVLAERARDEARKDAIAERDGFERACSERRELEEEIAQLVEANEARDREIEILRSTLARKRRR